MNPEYLDANKDLVSKLFRAYGLYNATLGAVGVVGIAVSKLFRAYGLYNSHLGQGVIYRNGVSKLFRAYGLYN